MLNLSNLMSLKGRLALITGANGHIGRIIALTLAELGADLILVDRHGSDYTKLTNEITNNFKVDIQKYDCDLGIQNDREELISTFCNKGAPLNILVNNAAFVGDTNLKGWVTDFEKQSVETWRSALEVNLTAAFSLIQGLSPILKKSKGANVINIGSTYGTWGPDHRLYEGTSMGNPAAYAASKGGLIQLTRWLATTLASSVRVNTLSPGGVFRNQPEIFVKRYNERTPLGRMATEDDFRGAIAYLASDLSSYVTGQNLAVDGGWGIW
jgi:NAD(P)-dependent dehydrogenase (short-subunit alcohol dehydrogenase family)